MVNNVCRVNLDQKNEKNTMTIVYDERLFQLCSQSIRREGRKLFKMDCSQS